MSFEDNRKRMLQQDEIGAAISSKRAALGLTSQVSDSNVEEERLYFKLLCPQPITGVIIGKGGATMTHLQTTTGAHIKLSANGDFYPGTEDRVILLHGDRDSLSSALRQLVTRIAEANERKDGQPTPKGYVAANRGPDGSFQIRLLIPHNSAGVLIGKGGAIIKQMIDRSQCRMQMGEEADPYHTNERIFVLNASSTNALAAGAVEAMSVLHSQPKHRNYTNITPNYGPGAVVSGYGGSAMPGRPGGPQPPSMQYPSVGMSGGAMPPVPGPGPATGPVPGFTAGPMPGFTGGPMGGPTGGPMPPGGYPPQYPVGGMQPGMPPYMQGSSTQYNMPGSMPGNRGMGGGAPQAVPPHAQHRQPSQQHGGYGGGGSGAMGQHPTAQAPQPAAQMYGFPQHPGMQPPMYPPGTGASQPTAMPYANAYMPQAGAYTDYPVASGGAMPMPTPGPVPGMGGMYAPYPGMSGVAPQYQTGQYVSPQAQYAGHYAGQAQQPPMGQMPQHYAAQYAQYKPPGGR